MEQATKAHLKQLNRQELLRVWPELKGLGGTLYLHGNNWKARLGWNQAGVLAATYSL